MATQPAGPGGLEATFRVRARMRIAALGLTHAELADRLDAHGRHLERASVSQVIKGRMRPPHLAELKAWAAALETSEAFLLGFTWDPTPEPMAAPSTISAESTKARKLTQQSLLGLPESAAA